MVVSHLALDQKCRHALYQCIKCLLAGTFIRVTEFNYQKNNNKSIDDCSLCSVIVITVCVNGAVLQVSPTKTTWLLLRIRCCCWSR